MGVPERASYHAAKHGVIDLTKNAALECPQRGKRFGSAPCCSKEAATLTGLSFKPIL